MGISGMGDSFELWQFVPAETDVDWLNGTRPLPPFQHSTFSIMGLDIRFFGIFLLQVLQSDLQSQDSTTNYLAQTLTYPANFPQMMANAADSVTVYLRQNYRNSTTASGAVWHQVTKVEIRWPWLALPAFIVLASVALLVAAISLSKSDISAVRSWKSSSLPFLFHGIRDWTHEEWEALYSGNFESLKQMNAVADTMNVNLSKAVGSGTALTRQDLAVDESQADRPTSSREG